MDNQQSFFKRLAELADQAIRQGKTTATPFLTPAEQQAAGPYLRNRTIPFSFAGGYAQAERTRCLLQADPADTPDQASFLAASELTPASPGLAHRDYLGSLLALGVRRDQLGDIIVKTEKAYVIHVPELSVFFFSQVKRIGRVSAQCQTAELALLAEIQKKQAPIRSATVSALRVDAVLSALFHCSRSQSLEWFQRGLVQIDWVICQKPDQRVSAGQTITVRGRGRACLLQSDEKSSKGRIKLVYEWYA